MVVKTQVTSPGRRQGAAREHGVPAGQPPARLPDLRQGRRVPAAEPVDVARLRREPLRRRQADLPQAGQHLAEHPARPGAVRPLRPLHPLLRAGRRRPVHRAGRARRPAAGRHLRARALPVLLLGQHDPDLPGRGADQRGLPVPLPPVRPRPPRPRSPSTTPAAPRSVSTTGAASSSAGWPGTTPRSTRSGSPTRTASPSPTGAATTGCCGRWSATTRPARCGPRPGPRRSTSPWRVCGARSAVRPATREGAPGARGRRADRRPADAARTPTATPSSPAPCWAPTTSTSAPVRTPTEEARFLAAAVAGTGRGVTFADLERASSVLLVCLEPEEEAGTLFLRLRKAFRKRRPGLVDAGPAAQPRRGQDGRRPSCRRCRAARPRCSTRSTLPLDARSVVLVGERAAQPDRHPQRVPAARRPHGGPAGLGAAPGRGPRGRRRRLPAQPAARRPAGAGRRRPASTPRPPGASARCRADPGRDGGQMLAAAARRPSWPRCVVAGVELADLPDPHAARRALEDVGFVVSLETRASRGHRAGRRRLPGLAGQRAQRHLRHLGGPASGPSPRCCAQPNAMSDLRVLAALAEGLGADLGFRTAEGARPTSTSSAAWEGARAAAPEPRPAGRARPSPRRPRWCWRPGGWRSTTAARSTASPSCWPRPGPPVARVNAATAAGCRARPTPSTRPGRPRRRSRSRWRWTPAMVDGVVWVPARAPGLGLAEHLGAGCRRPGGRVRPGADGGLRPTRHAAPSTADAGGTA